MYQADICSTDELIAWAAELHGAAAQSAFASPYWLGPLSDTLAPSAGAQVFGLVVRARDSGAVAAVLPLAVRQENGVKTVRFADFGVSDYAAPLIGPAWPEEASAAAFRDAVRVGLSSFDLLRIERLLPEVAGRPNPLAAHPNAAPSRMSGNVMVVPDTVAAYVAALGRKMRKEVDRCRRHIEEIGPITLQRASTGAEGLDMLAALETLQSARWDARDDRGRYRLDQPAYARFYRLVVERGVPARFAEVLTVHAGDKLVGAIFGIRAADRFIVLRIASNDEELGRFSPGRITVLSVLDCMIGEGIRTFDLGIGAYDFKRRLGAEPMALVDITAPLSWIGFPVAAGVRTKAMLGRQPALKRLADQIRGRA